MSGESNTPGGDRVPAFEGNPSGGDIGRWFLAEKRHESNVGGDAWWLSREPHGACRMVAFVDEDVQEFWLLEVTTDGTSDMLWVMDGYDGFGFEWWRNPVTDRADPYWYRDGIVWMADRIVLHKEYRPDPSSSDDTGTPST